MRPPRSSGCASESTRGVPHWSQNRWVGAFSFAQVGQARILAVPHHPQKAALLSTVPPHAAQQVASPGSPTAGHCTKYVLTDVGPSVRRTRHFSGSNPDLGSRLHSLVPAPTSSPPTCSAMASLSGYHLDSRCSGQSTAGPPSGTWSTSASSSRAFVLEQDGETRPEATSSFVMHHEPGLRQGRQLVVGHRRHLVR